MKIGSKKNIEGLTLIEALIWFAIFAAVVAGVFSLYSSSRDSSNASTANKEIATVFSKAETIFANSDTKDLNNIIAIQLGLIPASLKVIDAADGKIHNIFGGGVALVGKTPSGFVFVYDSVPTGDVCSNIVRGQKAVGWTSVAVQGVNVPYDSGYNIADVAASCGYGYGVRSIAFTR